MNKEKIILVVDDNKSELMRYEAYLDRRGYQSILAQGGEIALKILQEVRVDVILLDMAMPGMNGLEVLGKIKENRRTKLIPVIFLSVNDSYSITKTAFSRGASNFMTKPACLDVLREMIDDCITHKRLAEASMEEGVMHKVDKLIEIDKIKEKAKYCAEYDHEGNILAIKEEFSKLFHRSQDEMVGKNLRDFVPFDKESYKQFWENICSGNICGKNAYFEVNDRDFFLSETYVPIQNIYGETIKVLHFAFDKK